MLFVTIVEPTGVLILHFVAIGDVDCAKWEPVFADADGSWEVEAA